MIGIETGRKCISLLGLSIVMNNFFASWWFMSVTPVETDRRFRNSAPMIFYNIFVDKSKPEVALNIVREQMEQARLYASTTPIRYILIGGENLVESIQEACGPNCAQIQHLSHGDEGDTLQPLWEYCKENPDDVVTYIHDKGSFHNSDVNDRFRTMLTKAVFSPECQLIDSNPQCNVCGARFAPMPHYHMPGNMWTAECSYVRKLIAPKLFPRRMDTMMKYILELGDPLLPRPREDYVELGFPVGGGRYAFEHWLGSHPQIKPCDVYPNATYTAGYNNLPEQTKEWTPILRQGPWIPLRNWLSAGQGDWACGRGQVMQFLLLYRQMPPSESFVWSFYDRKSRDCPNQFAFGSLEKKLERLERKAERKKRKKK